MSSLLVIGGTGFFGKSILDSYRNKFLQSIGVNKITIVSRNISGFKDEYPYLLGDTVKIHSLDITQCNSLPFADIVIHAAAATDATKYEINTLSEFDNIVQGATNYCSLARKYHRKSKILYVSSGAVYGQQPVHLETVSEDCDVFGTVFLDGKKRAYAEAKRNSENMFRDLAEDGLNVSIARCFAFVGPYLPSRQHFAIGNFLSDALEGKDVSVQAVREVYRSYMHSDDLSIWLTTLASLASADCPVFNVGSDESILIGDLAKLIGDIYGVGVRVSAISENQIDRYVPCIDKARKSGLDLNYDLTSSIIRTVNELKRLRANIYN